MTTPTLYKHKTSARAAAVKALGKDAEFEIVATDDGRFYWIDTSAAAADAAGAENDPGTSPEQMAENVAIIEEHDAWANGGGAGLVQLPIPEPEADEEEQEPKANLTVDLGITPELAALIYGLGEAAGAAIPVPQKRKGLTADAWEAAGRGEMPGALAFPASNKHAQKHADKLRDLTEAGDAAAVAAYQIGGTNTYSKALRDYRDALLSYLANIPQLKEAA